ncbi:MAG: CRTAC1 family protein [Bryobacteraceae bacterium]|nr:CRTAC1 family protein [Bryobacteraceae bacterium]
MNNSASANKHQVETMIAGVAVFDYNNDGMLDIYFVNGAELPGLEKTHRKYFNALYRNNGDSTWTDVTAKANVRAEGFGMGVAAADYDNDGWTDLYLAGVNRNQLMHNNGDGTFADVTARAGVAGIHPQIGKTWAISAGWFDYDNDGHLDLIVVNYVTWDIRKEPQCSVGAIRAYCSPDSYSGQPNILYRNNGNGTFTDVSERSGLGKYIGKGMGVAFADYDGDGFTDIFVSNDTLRNFLFHNNGNGVFTETGIVRGVAYNENGKSIAGMGTDFRDVDNDGRPDIFVVGMVGDTFPLFLNRGRDFMDVTSASGVARASGSLTAWGSGIVDFDNDGWKDLFASCASILDNSVEVDRLPAALPNLLLRNPGNGKFTNVSAQAGAAFTTPGRHRGAAFGDLNNDGSVDIVVVTQNAPPEILINRPAPANHWLLVKLIGTASNRDGLGTRIIVTPKGGKPIHNHATTSVGYSSSSDRRVHFGLGAATLAESVEIIWPSRVRQVLKDVAVDRILTVTETRQP